MSFGSSDLKKYQEQNQIAGDYVHPEHIGRVQDPNESYASASAAFLLAPLQGQLTFKKAKL
jgi:hypothetical protein